MVVVSMGLLETMVNDVELMTNARELPPCAIASSRR
jgi:hypothetical protein